MIISKNDIEHNSNELIFELYKLVFDKLKENLYDKEIKVIKLEFNSDITFLHPFFLINIYNFYELLLKEKINKKILLDFRNLNEKIQYWTLIYLNQYIDYNIIHLENKKSNFDKNIFTNYLEDLVVFTTVEHKNNILTAKKAYNFLPITKITPLSGIDMDKDYSSFEDSDNNRHIFYLNLQLETKEIGLYRNKSDKVWTDLFETYLEIAKDKTDSMFSFKNILFECVDNIQKHTKNANGYIAFYKNKKNRLNEFIVCDDYENGFIDTYLDVLVKESNRINKIYKDQNIDSIKEKQEIKNILENYDKDIKKLKEDTNNSDIEILEKLFCIGSIPQMHQAGRIIMHFGIPTLIKLLNKLNNEKNKLEIYLHRKERSYYISYINGVTNVKEILANSVKGTYIHLSFDFDSKIDENKELNLIKLDSNDFKSIFNRKAEIDEIVDSFDSFDLNSSLASIKSNFYIKYDDTNISDFLRSIYLLCFKNDIKNIIIYNFPLEKYKNYINILIEVLYPNDNTDYEKQTYVAFLNEDYPQVLIIGGKNKNELYNINYYVSQYYNYYKDDFFNYLDIKFKKKLETTSSLFYNIEDKKLFLPFELFLKSDKYPLIFLEMINNFLDSDKGHTTIHLDTKDNIHLKRFFNFKEIFENSFWINRIAYYFANLIRNKSEIVLVGYWYYSSQIISVTKHLIDKDDAQFVIYDYNEDLKRFKKFVEKKGNDKLYLFFTPVIVNAKKINNYLDEVKNKEIYTAIQLIYKQQKITKDISSFLKKDITNYISNSDECEDCFNLDTPLYELDKNTFNIKDLYLNHNNLSKSFDIKENISWENSIYFGHVHRGNNHYLYYTKTINFLQNNKFSIIEFFNKNIKKSLSDKIPIIFCPINETNHNFITLIDSEVFRNNSRIHYFDIKNKEQNLSNLENFKEVYEKSELYDFYFIDDEISSGVTIEYFHTILTYITNLNDIKFYKVLTLINRNIEFSNKLNKLNKYYEEIHSFKDLPIKPIKTNMEKCYLCEREKYFQELVLNSSLIFIKQQFRKGAIKIQNKEATFVEYKDFNTKENIKNYLKISSVEYIYKNLEKFVSLNDIEIQLKEYGQFVYRYYKFLLNDGKKLECLMVFIDIEIKIAFLKALSFPKVLFYKNIKELIHKYILLDLKKFLPIERIEYSNKIEKKEIDLYYIYDKNEIERLHKYYPDLVDNYKYKTNIDYLNFLIITSSYLKINFILSWQFII
jgi:hypothetical protein